MEVVVENQKKIAFEVRTDLFEGMCMESWMIVIRYFSGMGYWHLPSDNAIA